MLPVCVSTLIDMVFGTFLISQNLCRMKVDLALILIKFMKMPITMKILKIFVVHTW